jgi:hypothetical protein
MVRRERVWRCYRLEMLEVESKPAPLQPKGAAPRGMLRLFRLRGWTRFEQDAVAGRGKPGPYTETRSVRELGWVQRTARVATDGREAGGGEIISGYSAYGRVEAKVQVLWLLCGGGCRYGYYFHVCA